MPLRPTFIKLLILISAIAESWRVRRRENGVRVIGRRTRDTTMVLDSHDFASIHGNDVFILAYRRDNNRRLEI